MAKDRQSEYAPIALRKKELIVQGALYRADLSLATKSVRANLNTESLATNLITEIAMAAFSALKSRTGLKVTNLQTVLPLVLSGVSLLSKKAVIRPILRGVAIAASVAGIAAFVLKVRARRRAAAEVDPE